MQKTQSMNDTTPAGNGHPHGNDEYLVKIARAMRRALQRAANYAIRHDDPVAGANEALEILQAELLWRFEILGYRQQQHLLIVPAPLPPQNCPNPHVIVSCMPITISQSNA